MKKNRETQIIEDGDVVICKDSETNTHQHLKYKDRFLHGLYLGDTKQTSQYMTSIINQDILNSNCGLTVFSSDANRIQSIITTCKEVGRPYTYLNLDGEIGINPLDEEVVTIVEIISSIIEEKYQLKDEKLITTREILHNAIAYLKQIFGEDLTFAILEKFLCDKDFGVGILEAEPEESYLSEQFYIDTLETKTVNLNDFFMKNYYGKDSSLYCEAERLREFIRQLNGNAYINNVFNISTVDRINFHEHFKRSNVIIVYIDKEKLDSEINEFSQLILDLLGSAVFKRKGNEQTRIPHYLYLDQFKYYCISCLSNLLTQGRAYRLSVNGAAETINELKPYWDNKNIGNVFKLLVTTNMRNVFIFSGIDSETANYYKECFNDTVHYYNNEMVKENNAKLFKKKLELAIPIVAKDLIEQKEGELYYRIIESNVLKSPRKGVVLY